MSSERIWNWGSIIGNSSIVSLPSSYIRNRFFKVKTKLIFLSQKAKQASRQVFVNLQIRSLSHWNSISEIGLIFPRDLNRTLYLIIFRSSKESGSSNSLFLCPKYLNIFGFILSHVFMIWITFKWAFSWFLGTLKNSPINWVYPSVRRVAFPFAYIGGRSNRILLTTLMGFPFVIFSMTCIFCLFFLFIIINFENLLIFIFHQILNLKFKIISFLMQQYSLFKSTMNNL